MTPEEAFEKWWDKGGGGVCGKDASLSAFLAGLQYQEMNQINCLYEIRKAVGDPEGRLMQDDLIQRVKELANPWRPIKTAPKNGDYVLIAHPRYWRAMDAYWSDDFQEWRRASVPAEPQPTHWTPLPSCKSVTTEKEEA